MTQVADNIWVGSCSESANTSFLQERGIEHILCCAEEYTYPPSFLYTSEKSHQWYHVPIKDNRVEESTERHFREGAAKLNEWVEQGNQVLVHCYQGKSRSVSVILAYLILYKGWSFTIAFLHLKQRYPRTNPYHLYLPILQNLHTSPLFLVKR
jgi:atypical dual specificity phosphatase